MIFAEELIKSIFKKKINFFTGVPDSILKPLSEILQKKNKKSHIIATNEGSAISLGIGYYLSDLNGDDMLNIQDLIALVNLILISTSDIGNSVQFQQRL